MDISVFFIRTPFAIFWTICQLNLMILDKICLPTCEAIQEVMSILLQGQSTPLQNSQQSSLFLSFCAFASTCLFA